MKSTPPGEVMSCWWEDWEGDVLHTYHGSCLVVATSRHGHSITADLVERGLDEAIAKLAAASNPDREIVGLRRERWHAVTKVDIANGSDADLGSYAADGSGLRWIDVALPVFAPAVAP